MNIITNQIEWLKPIISKTSENCENPTEFDNVLKH